MKTFPSQIVCEHCDAVYTRRPLHAKAVAYCTQCAMPLYGRGELNIETWLALTVATGATFTIANVYPAVRIGFQGFSNDATLSQAIWALWHGPIALIAIPAAFAAIIVPFIQISLLAWLLVFARHGQRAPGFGQSTRALQLIRPWNMVEVATLAILVTMVKLHGTLDVQALPGSWAMGLSMLGLTVITNAGVDRLWALTEPAVREASENA